MVTVKVPWEPELLDPWKAAWDRLIWKAMIPKVKAIEGELNRNPPGEIQGRSQKVSFAVMIEINAHPADVPCCGYLADHSGYAAAVLVLLAHLAGLAVVPSAGLLVPVVL